MHFQCTVSCGTGHRSRQITCPSGLCRVEDRPVHAEYCNAGPCSPTSISQTSSSTNTGPFSAWLVTEWSHCSEACGTGIQSRLAVCGLQSQNSCSAESKPELSRDCSSEKQCGGQWFTGKPFQMKIYSVFYLLNENIKKSFFRSLGPMSGFVHGQS